MDIPGLRLSECVDDDRLASSSGTHNHTRVPRQHCLIQLDHLVRLHNDGTRSSLFFVLLSATPRSFFPSCIKGTTGVFSNGGQAAHF